MEKEKKPVYDKGPGITAKQERSLFQSFTMDQVIVARAAAKIAGVNKLTAERYYRKCREAIYSHNNGRAPRLFGEVEMDQAEFGGRGRKRLQTYLNRIKKILPYAEYQERAKAARAEHKTLVFGILQRGGQVYVHIIKRADKQTLMPIIRLVVEQGATVYTDKWRGFTDLGIDGYTHHSINHSVEYVDRHGHHANTIESFWSFAARRLRPFNGISKATLPLYLKECEFRWNHRDNFAKLLKALLEDHRALPRRRAGRGTSARRSRRTLPRPRVRIRRKSHTDSGPSLPRARRRARLKRRS